MCPYRRKLLSAISLRFEGIVLRPHGLYNHATWLQALILS